MTQEEEKIASAEAGSATAGAGDGGKAANQGNETTDSKNYDELERKFGEQGRELGEHREFIKNIQPLLQKLDASPELVKAVMEDKLDSKLVSAILEGKVKVEEAQQVVEAQKQVEKEMGKEAFKNASPAEIEKQILDKVLSAATAAVDERFKTLAEQEEFEDQVNEFISKTPDFEEYAAAISVWLNEHPDQDDIQIAYDAVKGKALADKLGKGTQEEINEAAKAAAANAGGGNAPSAGKLNAEQDPWDKLVAPRSNPNNF